MTTVPYEMVGVVHFLPKQNKLLLGLPLFRKLSGASNSLFYTVEDSKGNIRRFVEAQSDHMYERYQSVCDCDEFFGEEARIQKQVGDLVVYALYDNCKNYFLNRTIFLSEEETDRKFIGKLKQAQSYSVYSLLSSLNTSLSVRLEAMRGLPLQSDPIWRKAEVSYGQKHSSYWKIVDRRRAGLKAIDDLGLARFKSNQEMLEWMMRDDSRSSNEGLWLSAWFHLSEFTKYEEIMAEMGRDYLREASIFRLETLKVSSRISAEWLSWDDEGILQNFADQFSMPEMNEIESSQAIENAFLLHRLVTLEAFKKGDPHLALDREDVSLERICDAISDSEIGLREVRNALINASNELSWILSSFQFAKFLHSVDRGKFRVVARYLWASIQAIKAQDEIRAAIYSFKEELRANIRAELRVVKTSKSSLLV